MSFFGVLFCIGVALVVAGLLCSFFFKTSWGQWKDRSQEDAIYGKPGANIDKKKHPTEQDR